MLLIAEVERLRGAIEAAEHGLGCNLNNPYYLSAAPQFAICDCWKSKVNA
jgi:hypothetical protein